MDVQRILTPQSVPRRRLRRRGRGHDQLVIESRLGIASRRGKQRRANRGIDYRRCFLRRAGAKLDGSNSRWNYRPCHVVVFCRLWYY